MAYAAVASLGQTLDDIMHPDRHVFLYDKDDYESLRSKVRFLQEFLEKSPQGVDELEILAAKIRDLATKVEDSIETELFSYKYLRLFQFPDLATNSYVKVLAFLQIMMPFSRVYESGMELMHKMLRWRHYGMSKFFKEIDSVLEEVEKFRERCNLEEDLQSWDSLPLPFVPWRPNFSASSTPVGLDEDLLIIKDRLTGSESRLDVVPIVGMGGIGKTTLAENIYRDPLIVYHFHARAWVTVSQTYNSQEILLQLLSSLGKLNDELPMDRGDGLEEHLYKTLCGRRYLIVMDDLWSTDAWDDFKRYFPDNCNGSRILLTTRLEMVATYASSHSNLHFMNLLRNSDSWELFHAKVFGEEEGCQFELSEVGKQIAFDCKGLPLAIVVMAGILSKVNRTVEEWKKVAENLHSVANKDTDTCLEILFLSYAHLPQHLKACFLYMAIFPEDSKISVSSVIKLWIAEGFLKRNVAKTLEEVAEEYILELAERSLVSVFGKRGRKAYGRIKTIGIHDLLRDLCIREAQKEKFLRVVESSDSCQGCMLYKIPPNINFEERFYNCLKKLYMLTRVWSSPTSVASVAPVARSFLYTSRLPIPSKTWSSYFLLHVLDIPQLLFFEFPVEILVLCNLRYLAFSYYGEVPDTISNLWNLQTLIFYPLLKNYAPSPRPLPAVIWSMPRLRHLRYHVWYLSDFPCLLPGWKTRPFLANLQTLSEVSVSICQKQVLQEMPNLKKLGIWMETWDAAPFYINNLACLQKLEVLKCSVRSFSTQKVTFVPNHDYPPEVAFPTGLKELSLRNCKIPWKDMSIVGSLPNLERLKLRDYAFVGPEWEPAEGEFSRLNFLYIDGSDLVHWEADSIHFSLLRHLIVENCWRLEAIPSGIGEIPTLQIIEMDNSSPSAVTSAQEILEEQQSFGNDGLRVHIYEVGTTF